MQKGAIINIRLATPADAEAGSRVLRHSIAELCHADHGGDPVAIARWTGNKSPERWRTWLARPDAALFVAERAGDIVGVGMVDRSGEILLNYVSPEARYEGISSALLVAMEAASVRWGVSACMLRSTKTAARFYDERGYKPRGECPSGLLAKPIG